MNKRIVYIAHPISGNVAENMHDLTRILRYINLTFTDVAPIAPYYADIYALNDNNPLERKRGIDNDIAIINTGVFDELWLTGNKISFGMGEEIKLFKLLGKPVINYVGKF